MRQGQYRLGKGSTEGASRARSGEYRAAFSCTITKGAKISAMKTLYNTGAKLEGMCRPTRLQARDGTDGHDREPRALSEFHLAVPSASRKAIFSVIWIIG